MKLYSNDFGKKNRARKFSDTSPVWYRKARDSMPEIKEYVNDQEEIQSYEDTTLQAIFSRLLPEETVQYFTGKTKVEYTDDEPIDATNYYGEIFDRLNEVNDFADELREEFGLPLSMSNAHVFAEVQKNIGDKLKDVGDRIAKYTGHITENRRDNRVNIDNRSDESEPADEDIKQEGE